MDIEEKLKRIKDKQGRSLYTHLSNIISKMVIDQCPDPCAEFESYSQELSAVDSFQGIVNDDPCVIPEDGEELKPQIDRLRDFLGLRPPAEGEPGEEEAVFAGEGRDLMFDRLIMRECGVSLGEEETYLLHRSLRAFAAKRKLPRVEFWGKVLGRPLSYWVAETPGGAPDAEEPPADPHEPAGKGVNARCFWVTTDPVGGDWKCLPLVTAKQVRQARGLRYLFTGDLERRIVAAPPFVGLEKHYVALSASLPDRAHLRRHDHRGPRRLRSQAQRDRRGRAGARARRGARGAAAVLLLAERELVAPRTWHPAAGSRPRGGA